MKLFQVVAAAVPGIEQERPGLEFFFRHDVGEQGLAVLVLGQTVLSEGVDAVVQDQEIAGLPTAMHRIDQANAGHQAVRGPGALALGYFAKAAVALVLHAVVCEQKGLRWVV